MAGFPTLNFGQSERGLFTTEEIRRLMQVEHARSLRYDYPLALFLIEIDRLESLQDLYGVESRERILGSVITLLRSATRTSDVLGCQREGRLMALFPHTGRMAATAIARRLLTGCRELDFKSDGRSLRASLSIGIAEREGEEEFEQLVSAAESALLRAIQAGRDRFALAEKHARAKEAPALAAPRSAETVRPAVPARRAPAAPLVLPDIDQLPGATLEEKVQALFRALGPGSSDLDAVQAEVTGVLNRILHEERERQVPPVDAKREIELLETRVAKLKQLLDATEEELSRLVQEKSADPGIASIYRTVQGIAPGERNYEKKRELLTVIYRANVELLRQLKSLR